MDKTDKCHVESYEDLCTRECEGDTKQVGLYQVCACDTMTLYTFIVLWDRTTYVGTSMFRER